MSERKSSKQSEKPSQQNVMRHRSPTYYARLFHQGKEVWRSLKTQHFSFAKVRLPENLNEPEERKGIDVAAGDAKMSFGQAVTLYKQKLDKRAPAIGQVYLKASSRLNKRFPQRNR